MNERRKKLLLPVALVVAGLLAVAVMLMIRPAPRREAPAVRAPLVRVVPAEARNVELTVHAQGTVMPRTASDLVAEVAGRVEWVSPSLVSGGTFEAGEPLVRIESADYEAELESARASVARAESEAARASKERKRQRTLARSSVASESRIDDAENANRVAQAALREARAHLARAERNLERTELRAPYTGRVRTESVDPGQFVNRGTPVARLYAVDFAEVRLPLPDRELAYLEADAIRAIGGQSSDHPAVRLTAEFAGVRRSWLGEIVRSEGEIDARSRMVHVVARVEDPYGLKGSSQARGDGLPGMAASEGAVAREDAVRNSAPDVYATPLAVGLYVEAEIEGRLVEGAFVLPREALHDLRNSTGHVWIVDAEGRLRQRQVEVLRAQREEVVITSGLRQGERVSVSRLRAPIDGMEVRVAGEPEPSPASKVAPSAPASDPEREPSLAEAKR